MDKIIILGHENPDVDSIVSGYLLEKILTKKRYDVEFVIPDDKIEEETLEIFKRYGLDPTRYMRKINLDDKNMKYILVDHNERDLAGEVVCIIDHHPISRDIKIDNYYNKKISSTACYICQGNEELLDKYDLTLASIATLVDTASFHSTKSRDEDKKWVIDICNKYNLSYEDLYKEGLCLTNLDNIEKFSFNGFKRYNFDGIKVESSYIQVEEPILEKNKISKVINILKEYLIKNNLDAYVFIVHDMKEFKTMYYLITENKIEDIYYERYTARGGIIMPEVERKLVKFKR